MLYVVTTTTTTTTVWISSTPSNTRNHGLFFTARNVFTAPNESESEQALKKYKVRWSKFDVEILIGLWKEKYESLKTIKSSEVWVEIMEGFNEISTGPIRNLKDIKDKIRNLTTAYKKAKTNNGMTGASPDFPPFYEDFNSILGCRDAIILSEVKECGVPVLPRKRNYEEETDNEEEAESNDYVKAIEEKKTTPTEEKKC